MESVIFNSIKWSTLSELGVKLITPLSTMIMARILAPEAFGVLAVCTLITTFSEIIADAGFGKYIVQADFRDNAHLSNSIDVAFWSHFTVATIMCAIISLTSDSLAIKLGVPGHGTVISVASTQLLLMSLVSSQLAILRRRLEFRKIFVSRVVSTLSNVFTTIPLAFIMRSYWALVIGVLAGHIVNSIALIILTKWRPRVFFSIDLFKEMFSFSFWSMMEGLSHWFIFNFDIFLVSSFFSVYYIGLYKNCSQILLSFFGIVTASMSPVLLSVFSRIKEDPEYDKLYFTLTKLFMWLIWPISIGIFYTRDFVTMVLFGEQWMEGAGIVGTWALMMGLSLFLYSFPAEIFKSKGIPKGLFLYQVAFLSLLVPACVWAANNSFWTFVYTRTAAIVFQIPLFVAFTKRYFGWTFGLYFHEIKSILPPTLILIIFVLIIDPISFSHIWTRPVVYVAIMLLYALYGMFFLKAEGLNAVKLLQQKTVV